MQRASVSVANTRRTTITRPMRVAGSRDDRTTMTASVAETREAGHQGLKWIFGERIVTSAPVK